MNPGRGEWIRGIRWKTGTESNCVSLPSVEGHLSWRKDVDAIHGRLRGDVNRCAVIRKGKIGCSLGQPNLPEDLAGGAEDADATGPSAPDVPCHVDLEAVGDSATDWVRVV